LLNEQIRHYECGMTNEFIVGRVFPATGDGKNDPNSALLTLWVLCRHALVLQRALQAEPGPIEVKHEQFLHTFLAIAATWQQAAVAFRCADQRGCFMMLPAEFTSELRSVRAACDKTSELSLFKLILDPLRNNAGGHFELQKIRSALVTLSSSSFPLKVGGTSFFESTYPLATALVEKILEDLGIAPTDAERVFPSVIEFGRSLQKITDAAVSIAVQC
jgi:hypothetical protein